jgi:MFS family permease
MDDVIESVGSFGKFQYRVIVLIGLISALSSALLYATIFIAGEPELFCKIERIDNYSNYTNNGQNVTEELDQCKIWSLIMKSNNSKFIQGDNYILKSEDINFKYECYFDKTYYDKTIINEWNLVCDRNYKASLTQTVHIFGSIFGFCGGILGDKLGRRRSVLIFFVLLTLTLVISQFLLLNIIHLSIDSKYIIYSVSQFLIGLLVNCLYCTAYVLLFEFSTEKYRTIISNLNSYIYVGGELIALVVYYFSRNWHVLNWFIAIYSLLLLILTYFFLPESPLWLLSSSTSHNAYSKAIKILSIMAKTNGKKNYQIPDSVIEDYKQKEKLLKDPSETSSSNTKKLSLNDNIYIENSKKIQNDCNNNIEINKNNSELLINNDDLEISKSSENDESLDELNDNETDLDLLVLKQIFVPKKNLIKTLLLFFIWIALMLIYYGISLGVTSIDNVNPYLMYFLSSIAEIIGYIVCYINDVIGRKKTISLFLFITTLMYAFIAIFTEYITGNESDPYSFKAILLMIFALIGKCAVSGSYNVR